jgi:shikimate kinase
MAERQPQDNIVLIGYRAVGKSTIGALLAARLGRPFVDLDAVFEAEAGQSIAAFVEQAGWPAFRQREQELVRRYAGQRGLVIATGGGVVLAPENIALLRASGRLIWLKAAPATIRARLHQDPRQVSDRPSLTGQGTVAEIDAVLAAREPLYAAAADLTLEVDEVPPEAVVAAILDRRAPGEQP